MSCSYYSLNSLKGVLRVIKGKTRSLDYTLLETNMETQKGPCKDYSLSKMGLCGFPC